MSAASTTAAETRLRIAPGSPGYPQPMPPRLRTLPERHGGRVVLGLLIAILALGLALRMQAALTPPEDVGNDAQAYMAIAKGLYTEGHYGGPKQQAPNDWSPGAPLLYA